MQMNVCSSMVNVEFKAKSPRGRVGAEHKKSLWNFIMINCLDQQDTKVLHNQTTYLF